jgi:DNA-3-methyladenine glycosylase I
MLLEKAFVGGLVCGVDEAGRGPWAGPVCAGAVILNPKKVPKGLDDSKKLSAKTRETLEVEIKARAMALAWITILRKREAFRAAFDNFDPEKVAAYGEADRARLMADAGIIRSNAKIDAAISGAKIYLSMRDAGEDFSAFCWSFTDGRTVQNRWTGDGDVPAQTDLAVEVAKALKAKGFKFVGPVIVYAWMQAVGIVNDHLVTCYRHDQVKKLAR